MLEIFIPTKLKKYKEINKISNNFLNILKTYDYIKIEKFDSIFFEGIYIKSEIFINDIIILCNGEFGDFYFLDYDIVENQIESLGTNIMKAEKISKNIEDINKNFSEIINQLQSNKLLTKTKKEEINKKISSSFFSLSGIIFLLYKLKENIEENIKEMTDYKGKIEFEAQASILSETSKTKLIEIQANINKLESRIDFFINNIKSIII